MKFFGMLRPLFALALAGFPTFARSADVPFAETTNTVGHHTEGLETPVNQLVTPAGRLVELPGMRPQAIALSPDGQLLVTAGLTHELIVLNPATGEIQQRVPLPSGKIEPQKPVAEAFLNADKRAQLSFTGLVFSPDGSRIYLANVNGDIKVFLRGRRIIKSAAVFHPAAAGQRPSRKAEIPARHRRFARR